MSTPAEKDALADDCGNPADRALADAIQRARQRRCITREELRAATADILARLDPAAVPAGRRDREPGEEG